MDQITNRLQSWMSAFLKNWPVKERRHLEFGVFIVIWSMYMVQFSWSVFHVLLWFTVILFTFSKKHIVYDSISDYFVLPKQENDQFRKGGRDICLCWGSFRQGKPVFSQPSCLLVCFGSGSRGSLIYWPPGSVSVILNYGSRSESFNICQRFDKISEKFCIVEY